MPDREYKICLKMVELGERKASVLQILKPLVERPQNLHVIPRNVNKEEFALVVRQAGMHDQGDYTDWKFKTSVQGLYASYYERWFRFYERSHPKNFYFFIVTLTKPVNMLFINKVHISI
jgi:hypothetical protein